MTLKETKEKLAKSEADCKRYKNVADARMEAVERLEGEIASLSEQLAEVPAPVDNTEAVLSVIDDYQKSVETGLVAILCNQLDGVLNGGELESKALLLRYGAKSAVTELRAMVVASIEVRSAEDE